MIRSLVVTLLLPLAAVAQEKKGTQYAFLVGCSGYSETQLKPLPYTVNDIDQFRQALLETGFEADHIKMLHDKQGIRFLPEKKKILKEFATLLNGLKPEDTMIVALSGHGVHFKDDPTGFFCPLDADLKDKTTLIPFEGKEGLFDQLKACKAKRKLMIVNACRNDPSSNRALAAEKIDLDDAAPEIVPEGVAAIYSCRAGQKSYYDPKKQAGIFFDHVTRAWRGEYAKGEQRSTIEDFFREVSTRTKADADTAFGEAQVPEVKREYKEEWRVPVSRLAAEFREYVAATRAPAFFAGQKWLTQAGPKRFDDWQRLAKAGNATAMLLTAVCLMNGAGAPPDDREGAEWVRKAADLGFAPAMTMLGARHRLSGQPGDSVLAMAWFRKAADRGDAGAMNQIGSCHDHGFGGAKDAAAAAEWYQKALDAGHVPAAFNLALLYELTLKDQVAAVAWHRKAAALGWPAAMTKLGAFAQHGTGVPKDPTVAVEWYRKAAETGDAFGMTNLGYCLLNGIGTAKDETAAADWYRKAADLGNTFAMTYMGILHETGTGAAKDPTAAADWYRKAAAGGDAAGMTRYGAVLQTGFGVTKDEKAAVEWFRKAAAAGDVNGMRQLGVAYQHGLGVAQDYKPAVEWLRKAADAGDGAAMHGLGYLLEKGLGADKDETAAVAQYLKAAGLGNVAAKTNLGYCYTYGIGVALDATKATTWYRQAAEAGEPVAMRSYADKLERGYGVPQDLTAAVEWYRKAAKQGDAFSQQRLTQMGLK